MVSGTEKKGRRGKLSLLFLSRKMPRALCNTDPGKQETSKSSRSLDLKIIRIMDYSDQSNMDWVEYAMLKIYSSLHPSTYLSFYLRQCN